MLPIKLMGTLTLHVFSCYWSGEAPIGTKHGTEEDKVKWNTSAKNRTPGMFGHEYMYGCSDNWLFIGSLLSKATSVQVANSIL